MAQIIIAKFKLQEGKESEWREMSKAIQNGISQAPGFISRDTGSDTDGYEYCVVNFESKEQLEQHMGEAMEKYPEMFEKFETIVDMSSMAKTEIDLY